MNTVRQRLGFGALLDLAYALGHRTVGQQHELLDELCGVVRLLEVRTGRLAVLVDVEVQFLAIELHGTTFEATLTQAFGQSVQRAQLLSIVAVLARQYLLHLLVGIAAVALDDRMGYMKVLHVRFVVQQEDDRVAELLLVRTQRADEVTQPFGQHGDGAVYQIDTGGSLHSLLVYHGPLRDIVADVGNVHTDLPQLTLLPDAQRIVKILGILGVNGTGEDIAEVLAALDFLLCDARINLLGSVLHMLRILVRQPILSQDGMHLHIVVALLAQNVNHLADNVLRVLRRPLRNAHHGLLAVLATLQLLFRYQYVVHKDVAFGHQEGKVLLHLQLADGLVYLVRQYLNDHGLLDVFLATSHHGHPDAVTIHGEE